MIEFFSKNDNFLYYHTVLHSPMEHQFEPHLHSTYEILFFINGDATFSSDKYEYKLKPYDLILIPPNSYHQIKFDSNMSYERFCFAFSSETANEIKFTNGNNTKETSIIRLQDSDTVKDVFYKFDFMYENLQGNDFMDSAKAWLKALFYYLKVQVSDKSHSEVKKYPAIFLSCIDYIEKNLYTIKNVTEINDSVFVSYSYLIKLFKMYMNTTPKRYLTDKRLTEAKRLIANGEQPTAASRKVGFDNYTLFYKAYCSTFGYSPSQQTEKLVSKKSNNM